METQKTANELCWRSFWSPGLAVTPWCVFVLFLKTLQLQSNEHYFCWPRSLLISPQQLPDLIYPLMQQSSLYLLWTPRFIFLAGWKQLHCLYLTDQTSDRCIAAQKSQHWKDRLVLFQTWPYCTEKHHGGQWLLAELRLPSAVRCQQKQLL